jgi:hypothetical protein
MIFLALEAGHNISSTPVSTIYGGEQSKIHPWHDSLRFFRLMRKWKGRRLQKPPA